MCIFFLAIVCNVIMTFDDNLLLLIIVSTYLFRGQSSSMIVTANRRVKIVSTLIYNALPEVYSNTNLDV